MPVSFEKIYELTPEKGAGTRNARAVKSYVLQSNFCHYCGNYTPIGERSLDHIIPRSKGGCKVIENLVMACKTCNVEKGHKEYYKYIASIKLKKEELEKLNNM
jgi:5-methylcytosine-specific restriction endonuclease McrA